MYILIAGGRYGWQPYGQESITELEYNTALENKLPIIVFNTTYESWYACGCILQSSGIPVGLNA